jgi:hypothetical protein
MSEKEMPAWAQKEPGVIRKILEVAKAVEPVGKDKTATVKTKAGGQFSYAFRGVDAVMEALREPLIEAKLVIIPSLDKERWSQDGDNTIGVYDFVFCNAEAPYDTVTIPGLGYGTDYSDKGPGKAVSYAWRIIMEKVFYLAAADGDNEDDDNKRKDAGQASERAGGRNEGSGTSSTSARSLSNPIWFGKHKDKAWSHEAVSKNYLEWLVKNPQGDGEGSRLAQEELDRRSSVVDGTVEDVKNLLSDKETMKVEPGQDKKDDDDDLPF